MRTIKRSMLAGCAGVAMLAIGVTAALAQPGLRPHGAAAPAISPP